MTLTELRYIVAVARERHFGRAAAACFVSQPTLSVAVKKLEEDLGVLIFERHQHDVSITPVGERIVEQAQRVLEQAEAIRILAREGQDELKGELRLGVIYTVGPYLLPGLIPAMHERAPGLTLLIDEDYTANLAVKLKQGEIDMALLSTPFEVSGIEVRVLYKEPFVVALPREHALARHEQVSADDLARETLLLLRTGNCFRDQVIAACPACQGVGLSSNPLQKTLEGSSIETIRQMVAAGSGVTVLPATSVGAGSMDAMLEYRPFSPPVPSRDIALAFRGTYPRKRQVDVICDAVRASRLPGAAAGA